MPNRPIKILGVTGSLREGSYNTSLLEALREFLPESVDYEIRGCAGLPLYEASLDGETMPAPVLAFREAIESADAMIISTPEYNSSVPGGLKNAIDWASRPGPGHPLVNKPTGILSASPGVLGGVRAQGHLKQILSGTRTPVYLTPDFLVGEAGKKFDAEGKLTDEKTLQRLERFATGFIAWIDAGRS